MGFKEYWDEFCDYFNELCKTLVHKFKKIISATVTIWLVIPIIIFVCYALYLIIFGITSDGLIKITMMAVDVSLPWYVSVILAPWKTLVELIIILFCVTNYYNYR